MKKIFSLMFFALLFSCEKTLLEESTSFLHTKWKYLANYTNNTLYSNGITTNSYGSITFSVYQFETDKCYITIYSNNIIIQEGTWPVSCSEVAVIEDVINVTNNVTNRHFLKYTPKIIDNKFLKLSLREYKHWQNDTLKSNATFNEDYNYDYFEKFE